MTLEQYIISLGRRWKLVVMCIVVLGVAAAIGSKAMKPVYQSTTLIQVTVQANNNSADYSSLLASDQLVQTESQLVTSEAVLQAVASRYAGMTAESLSKEVTASPRVDTQLFTIDVQDENPTRAANLANDIATTLIAQQTQLSLQGSINILQTAQQDLQQTQQHITSVENQMAALQAKSGTSIQITNLSVQLNSLLQHSVQVQGEIAQLQMTEAANSNFLVIVQHAYAATAPVRPNLLLNTGIGLFAGVLLALSLVLLAEQYGTPIGTIDALSKLLGLSILASISQVESEDEVVNPMENTANAEAYRILRTNLGFATVDKPLRTMLVTSAISTEGKSTISANLAIFMAKAGKSTVLIDADLRRPTQHEQFSLSPSQPGLSNAIAALNMMTAENSFSSQQMPSSVPLMNQPDTAILPTFSLESFMYAVDIPNLRVMPSGTLPPNPSELLDSKAMQHLLTVIKTCGAEVVIFDAPPLLGLSDARILASRVDGTLVVVDSTRVKKRTLKQMKSLLDQANANVLGAVINKQRHSRDQYAYSYYAVAQEQESLEHNSNHAISTTTLK